MSKESLSSNPEIGPNRTATETIEQEQSAKEARMAEMIEWARWTGAMVEAKASNHKLYESITSDGMIGERDAMHISQSPVRIGVVFQLPFNRGVYRGEARVSADENGTITVVSNTLQGHYRSPSNVRNEDLYQDVQVTPRVI